MKKRNEKKKEKNELSEKKRSFPFAIKKKQNAYSGGYSLTSISQKSL